MQNEIFFKIDKKEQPTQEQLDLIAKAEAEAVQVSPEGKRDGGAVLRAISKARTATLSPAIYNNDFEISAEDFVKGSPKLEYVLSAIESMKQKDHTTGQLLYMPLHFLELCRNTYIMFVHQYNYLSQ